MMHLGIIGPPQSGKSTLFAAVTGTRSASGHGAQRAVVQVPDARLQDVARIVRPKKITSAEIEYLDAGGPATTTHREEGVPAPLRQCDALVATIRDFEDDRVPHPRGSVDAARDLADLELALVLADLGVVEPRLARVQRTLKVKKDPALEQEQLLLAHCISRLESETPLRQADLTPEQQRLLRGFGLLTAKPLLVVINVSEQKVRSAATVEASFRGRVSDPHCDLLALSAQIEMEIAQLEPQERGAFLDELGIGEPALGRMIRRSYQLLGQISFFTATDPEVRAWTLPRGAPALEAALAVHSDIARGFIRAEVVSYDDYVAHGGVPGAKKAGRFRLEGKDYVVQDGDVIYFRFNV